MHPSSPCLVTIDAYSLIHKKQTIDEQPNYKMIGFGPTEKMRAVSFFFDK